MKPQKYVKQPVTVEAMSRESPKHVIDYLLSDYPEVAAALGIKEGNHAE